MKVFKRSLNLCESELIEKLQKESSTNSKSGGATTATKSRAQALRMDMESVNSEYGVIAERRRTQ